jgi:hypothetical protein
MGQCEDDDLNFVFSVANNTSLEALDDNNFLGVLPEIVSNFSTELMKMTFARNHLRGSIPTEIGNLGETTVNLTGTIPRSMVKLQKLSDLFLNGSKISGRMESSLGIYDFFR